MKGVPAKDFKPEVGARVLITSTDGGSGRCLKHLAGVDVGVVGTIVELSPVDSKRCSACKARGTVRVRVDSSGGHWCIPLDCLEVIGGTATVKADSPRKPKVGDVVDVSRRYGGGEQTSLTIRAAQECQCCDWRGTDGDGCDSTFNEEDIIRYHN